MTEIAKFDLSEAARGMRERIQQEFVASIPPEQWEAMIKAELQRFTAPTKVPNGYGHTREEPSPLGQLCESVLRELARKELEALLAQNKDWTGKVSALVKEWMTENSQRILESAVLGMCQTAAQNTINNMGIR